MAGYSTAVVLVGPAGVGPFHARAWRATHCITLIEKHRQAWMPSAIGYSAGFNEGPSPLYLPTWLPTSEAMALVVAATAVEAIPATDLANLEEASRAQIEALVERAVHLIAGVARLGVVLLEAGTALDAKECRWLQDSGVDIEYYAPQLNAAVQEEVR